MLYNNNTLNIPGQQTFSMRCLGGGHEYSDEGGEKQILHCLQAARADFGNI